jgi:hypothetical protein
MDAIQILDKLIRKGGMMGYCANLCIDDEKKAAQFISEMKQYIHPNSALVKQWGKTLTKQIENFN